MLSYCLRCRKNAESKNPKLARTKEQEAKRLLSNLTGVKIPFLSDLPILNAFL